MGTCFGAINDVQKPNPNNNSPCGTDSDDEDYDDTINPANLTGASLKEKESIATDGQEAAKASDEDDEDYEDVVISGRASQPKRETIAINTNTSPACGSSQDCPSVSDVPVHEIESNNDDSQSEDGSNI